mgnify:CR=1 FL=1
MKCFNNSQKGFDLVIKIENLKFRSFVFRFPFLLLNPALPYQEGNAVILYSQNFMYCLYKDLLMNMLMDIYSYLNISFMNFELKHRVGVGESHL